MRAAIEAENCCSRSAKLPIFAYRTGLPQLANTVYYIVTIFFLPALITIFSVLAKRLAANSVSDMNYLVSRWALNLTRSTLPQWNLGSQDNLTTIRVGCGMQIAKTVLSCPVPISIFLPHYLITIQVYGRIVGQTDRQTSCS